MALNSEPLFAGRDLLIELERGGGTLHEQLERNLRQQVRTGRLAPGTRLPSSRALAAQLGISRGVVLEAYAQLTAEGYLTSSQGAPTRVAPVPAPSASARRSRRRRSARARVTTSTPACRS